MYRLEIPGYMFEDTPIWWQNFINDCRKNHPDVHGQDFTRLTAAILKEEYHALKIFNPAIFDIEALSFEKEAHKTWFLLRWS
jgi:hypothetical protein